MGDPERVIIGKWFASRLASQNLIQQLKNRAKRSGTTQTGKDNPSRKIGEKFYELPVSSPPKTGYFFAPGCCEDLAPPLKTCIGSSCVC